MYIFYIFFVIILCVNYVFNSYVFIGVYLVGSLEEVIFKVIDKGDLVDKVEGVYIIGGSFVYKVSIE